MRRAYEVWQDSSDDSLTFASVENVQELRRKNLLSPTATLLFKIEADTPEEANAIYHVRMGWEPYQPMGLAVSCPKGCGAVFYPKGSGMCRNCGEVD